MRHILLAVATASLLAASLPGMVSADPVQKYHDHATHVACDQAITGGHVVVGLDTSSAFGSFAEVDVWLDPAVPFEDPPAMSGFSEAVTAVEAAGSFTAHADVSVTNADGDPVGDGTVDATMTATGAPTPIPFISFGNHHSNTEGTAQTFAGQVAVHLPGLDVTLDGCTGQVTDTSVHEASPRSFVLANSGVEMQCIWQTADAIASVFATDDVNGFFADAYLETADTILYTTAFTGSIDATSMAVQFSLADQATQAPSSATAVASFDPFGSLTTSILTTSTTRLKLIQQAMASAGQLQFATGQTFVMDSASCHADTFDSHLTSSQPKGPKTDGKPPVNDTMDGAIALQRGSKLNAQTGGAALEPEVQTVTCPEGFGDQFGRTLWYSITGTGGDLTFDTAGSDFDSVIAAYDVEGGDLVEVACDDDVAREPIGASYQAAITVPTVAGRTYYVQVGGWMRPFSDDPQFGRLRLAVR